MDYIDDDDILYDGDSIGMLDEEVGVRESFIEELHDSSEVSVVEKSMFKVKWWDGITYFDTRVLDEDTTQWDLLNDDVDVEYLQMKDYICSSINDDEWL